MTGSLPANWGVDPEEEKARKRNSRINKEVTDFLSDLAIS